VTRTVAALLLIPFLISACSALPEPAATPGSSSAPAGKPGFTDVSQGSTESFAGLVALTGTAVVVRPVIYLKNPDFCTAMGKDPASKDCTVYPFGLERSEALITLPLSPQAAFALPDPDSTTRCAGPLGTGTCAATAKQFKAAVANDEPIIRLTTTDGTATRLAVVRLLE
jgi:hypothetical protein